jgi:hypothetical protein
MPPLQFAALAALLPLAIADILREPDYFVERDKDRWVVRKPGGGARQPFTISEHQERGAAERHKRLLPRLRFGGLFVRFNPATFERTMLADWSAHEDGRAIAADVRDILNRFAPAEAAGVLESTPLYLARLFGATGHTAEESTDSARFVIYLDPFRATGRLHAAATLTHEATHAGRYRARGFHANRAAAVLPKRDFVLLGLADEYAAYEAEASLVRAFIGSLGDEDGRRAARDAIVDPGLGWPAALAVMLGFEGPREESRRAMETRRQVTLDIAEKAGAYWDSRHGDALDPALRQTIRNWYEHSGEWKEIAAERPAWAL